MEQGSYRIIHLQGGTTLYTQDEYVLPSKKDLEDGPRETSVLGLDGIEYHFIDSAVILTHLSTPESRNKLNELKHMLQSEVAAFTHGKMMEMQEAMADQQRQLEEAQKGEQRTQSAVDRVMGKGARPVALS